MRMEVSLERRWVDKHLKLALRFFHHFQIHDPIGLPA
eukprot:CAMPEP_0119321064 /NCGR_PEP_ID=MMETSP1333-20130426/54299_1 /TAXON_ID=418940 /ORGANISM="Scyphosphaera apsteinii, Strain RCC1455" /LENGTH=36 /DNA_ID= /DNA_START= /DNA_END= /DNA_ORIENTATION=